MVVAMSTDQAHSFRPIDSGAVFTDDATMKPIGVYDAHATLTQLIRRVAAGEEVVIGLRGGPMVRLLPVDPPRMQRLGIDEGGFIVPDDFNIPSTVDGLDPFGL